MNQVEHLYIHIPFCNHICWYCDFKRSICNSNIVKTNYINKLIKQLQTEFKDVKFKTIYIGGGTPNSLNELLYPLLEELSYHLKDDYEFTIECNVEFFSETQLFNFIKYKVNRLSFGVQTTNDEILKQIGRHHNIKEVVDAIKILNKNKFENYSIDLIYGFNEQSIDDINKDFIFIQKYKIPHVSWYSLEIKDGSTFGKSHYKLDEGSIEEKLKVIENNFKKLGYERYEVSNWSLNKKFESQHNLAYWNTKDWVGMGYGAFGLENKDYYENIGSIENFTKKSYKLNTTELYQQVWIMGLRTKYGLDLNNNLHKLAYEYFKKLVDHKDLKISNNRVVARNLNTIDNILIKII